MGRFSFVVVVLGLAGCGRLGFGESGPADPNAELGANIVGGVVDASARSPAVCESLPNLATSSCPDVDLSLATTPTGIAVVWVPVAGGDLTGIALQANRAIGNLTTIKTGVFTASSAAYLDGQLIAGGISSSRAIVHTVVQPMGAGTEIGNFDGEFVGKTTLTHSNGDRVAATSCSSGLTMNAFDNAWNGQAGTFSVTTNQTMNIDATPIDTQSFAVWSTSTSCNYETITSKTTGTTRATNSKACLDARLTSNNTEIGMVFDGGGKVGLVVDDASTLSVLASITINGARSPRVLWDGSRYWVSYFDTGTSKVVIGYIDEYGMLLTSQLQLDASADKAYELGMFDGQPWLFAVGADMKLSANRMCVPAY